MGFWQLLLDFRKFLYQQELDKENRKIELVCAKVDTSVCNWQQSENNPQVFFKKAKSHKTLSSSPIFDFTLLNHFPKPVLLYKIHLHLKFFPLGMQGSYIKPIPVTSEIKYQFDISGNKTDYSFELKDALRIARRKREGFRLNSFFPRSSLWRIAMPFIFLLSSITSKKSKPR